VFHIAGCSDFTVKNTELYNPIEPVGAGKCNIYFCSPCTNITIDTCWFHHNDTHWALAFIDHGDDGFNIVNCLFDNTLNHGIYLDDDAKNITIEGNTFRGLKSRAIYTSGGSGGARDITGLQILNNKFIQCSTNSPGYFVYLAGVRDFNVSNNYFYETNVGGGEYLLAVLLGVGARRSSDGVIGNNVFNGIDAVNPAHAIRIIDADRITINNNKIIGISAAGGSGIYIGGGTGSNDVLVDNNDINNWVTGVTVVAGCLRTHVSPNNRFSTNTVNITDAGTATGPRLAQSIQCFLARATNNVLAASGTGNYSALAQPDAISGRNLVAQCFNGGGGGIGTVTVTGTDQFGNAVSEAHVFAGAATFDMAKIFATINVNGVVLTGLAGGDTISVGYGNKLGVDHKLFTGAMRKVFKSGVGDITATAVEDAVYHAVTMPANILANETYAVQSLDCLA
jgi:hypothetical protein